MTAAQAAKRHAELSAEIRRHDHAYYVEAKPAISDFEYDKLYRELLDLEKEFPKLVTPESPSQRVGGAPLKEFKQVAHALPMLSLDNTYSQDEVRAFVTRLQKLLPGQELEFVVEPKVDGVAVGKVDTEAHVDVKKQFGIHRFPTIMYFEPGKKMSYDESRRYTGQRDIEHLQQWINGLKAAHGEAPAVAAAPKK